MKNRILDDAKLLVAKLTSGRTGHMKSYVAIFLVSVGKENFEEEAIESAIKMINKEFKACCIVVADTLQRHNIATEKEIPHTEAYDEALVQGDKWIQRNMPCFINNFTIPYEIIRWDSLINDPSFAQKEKKFASHITEHASFSTAMHESINEYGKRLLKHLGEAHFERIKNNHESSCYSYLKEECIALTILPKKISFNEQGLSPCAIVYPGKSTSILTENYEAFIKNEFDEIIQNYCDFLKWLPYRFTRIKKHVDDSHMRLSSEASTDSIKIQNKLSVLKQIDFINNLAEAQLASVEKIFKNNNLINFQKYLLDYFLNSKSFSFEREPLDSLSIQSLAHIFGTQLTAMFNILEEKYSNKCKANMIRILKREVLLVVNTEKLINLSLEGTSINT